MKVLYINYLFDTNYSSVGAAVHVKEFVHATAQAGVDIKSYDLNRFDSEETAAQTKSRAWLKTRLSRYVGQINALISNIGYFRREWKIVSEEKPDAILVRYNLLNFSLPIIAKLKGIPFIVEVNSPMALEHRKFNKKQFSLPFFPEWAERLNLKLADRAYTVSGALRNYFVEHGIDANKISVVPNGVDVERFSPNISGTSIRCKYNLGDRIVLGFIGSFHYWHGLESLEKYVTALCGKFGNVAFLFVGDGPMRAELEAELSKRSFSDRVFFAGYVPHDGVSELLAAMDIVFAPYPPMEFFYFSPLKLFEYMAAGKPVVASRVGQIEDMVEDGINGLLYDAGEIEQLIARSSELIEDKELRTRIGKQARETMCANHSWRVNADKVIKLIEESLNGEHGPR